MVLRVALLRLQHEKLISPGFGAPDFALAACELAHACVVIGYGEGLEFLGLGIKAQNGIRTPVADPYRVVLVNIDGVGLWPVARQVPACPTLGPAVKTEEIAAVPTGDPESAVAVAPDPAGALARHRRFQNSDGPGLGIDLTEIAAGERSEEHLAVRRGGNTVRSGAARGVVHRHGARFGIEAAVDAVLSGEPEHALAIKSCRIEVGVAPLLG